MGTLTLERQMRDSVYGVLLDHGADEQTATELADGYAESLRHFQVESIMVAALKLKQKKLAA